MPRVLIVDDDASSLRPLAKLLALDGFEVFATDIAQHGLALLGVERFDAIVTDLAMPHDDGIAVLDAARRL